MFGDKKDIQENLKDSASHLGITIKDSRIPISYTKTNKLITALYMVTDMIDKEEPLRNKLRTLGTSIISDINSSPANACAKISEVMSFLDIAAAVNIISPMNCGILKKEFSELDSSIQEAAGNVEVSDKKIDLSEFFKEEPNHLYPYILKDNHLNVHRRIGVQKGKTLLKAIKDMSNSVPAPYEAKGFRSGSDTKIHPAGAEVFETLKRQRRGDIVNIIKLIGGSATIKDIKDRARLSPVQAGLLASCGEKTLQRELVAMVKGGVLKKLGEKRWSRYFISL